MSIRERMIDAHVKRRPNDLMANIIGDIDAQLAACPEIAALDHAREGWLASDVIDSALIVWGRSALGNVGDKRGRWLPMPESS